MLNKLKSGIVYRTPPAGGIALIHSVIICLILVITTCVSNVLSSLQVCRYWLGYAAAPAAGSYFVSHFIFFSVYPFPLPRLAHMSLSPELLLLLLLCWNNCVLRCNLCRERHFNSPGRFIVTNSSGDKRWNESDSMKVVFPLIKLDVALSESRWGRTVYFDFFSAEF